MLHFLKSLVKEPRKTFKHYNSIFVLAVFMLWAKTFIVYLTQFQLGVEGFFQYFILFINPISSCLFVAAICFFFKGKGQYRTLLIGYTITSIWLYSNIVYYRFFNDFITVQTVVSAPSNAGQLGESIFGLIYPWDLLFFLDVFILFFIVAKRKLPVIIKNNKKALRRTLSAVICVFLINLGLAEIDRPQLLKRSFDRNYLVKYLGLYNFAIYDVVQTSKTITQRALADSSDVTEVENYAKANYAEPNPEYFGTLKGKNVFLISLESLQSFIIDYQLNGVEVTPYLNSLAHSEDTLYFPNFFHQTGQGKTSDAEFMIDTSLYPMAQGAVYVNKSNSVMQGLPAILSQEGGYYTATLHGNYKTFWNRNEMYRTMGYDDFFDAEYYNMTEENTKNYGMKDVPFFEESAEIVDKFPQPFFAKMITLSNHFPFGMDPADTTFPVGDFGDDVVNQYFQSANYLDQSLQMFVEDLKAKGLYENSVFVLYGDHYGLSGAHNEAMANALGKEAITPFDEAQLQRTVFMIHSPGLKGGINETYVGETDIRPTLLHLLGIDTSGYLEMGTDMLSPEHFPIVPFRNGDFITEDYTYIDEKFYDNKTGLEMAELPEDADKLIEANKEKLHMSDEIINKDLLRFYTPPGFEPVNRDDYNYLKPSQAEIDAYRSVDPDRVIEKDEVPK